MEVAVAREAAVPALLPEPESAAEPTGPPEHELSDEWLGEGGDMELAEPTELPEHELSDAWLGEVGEAIDMELAFAELDGVERETQERGQSSSLLPSFPSTQPPVRPSPSLPCSR